MTTVPAATTVFANPGSTSAYARPDALVVNRTVHHVSSEPPTPLGHSVTARSVATPATTFVITSHLFGKVWAAIGVRTFLGLLLLVVPGIILAVRYALAVPAAVLEDRGPAAALARSMQLTRGHGWRIFAIYVLLGAIVIGAALAWLLPASVGIAPMVRPRGDLNALPAEAQAMLQVGAFVTQSVVGPIVTIALSLLYYDELAREDDLARQEAAADS